VPKTYKPTATVYDYAPGVATSCTCNPATAKSATTWPGITVTVSLPTPGASNPQAIFSITPNPPLLGRPFTADARQSYDRPSTGRIASYSWTWSDGTPASSGQVVSHTYTQPGTYTITLTVADTETPANMNSRAFVVVVAGDDEPVEPGSQNRPPVAGFTITPPRGSVGGEVTLDARTSSDPDGDALMFEWSFGDGSTGTGSLARHTYTRPGSYLIRLTVRDTQNGSTDAAQSLVVDEETGNRPPVVVIATGPRTGPAPLLLTFDARNSYDPDGDALSFRWEFRSDGELVGLPESGAEVTRMFSEVGSYTVDLTVTDANGAVTPSEPQIIQVFTAPQPPDDDPPAEQEVPDEPNDSACQRPSGICGMGGAQCLIGSLVGLSFMHLSRRRRLM
jgi:PKD repeat protein